MNECLYENTRKQGPTTFKGHVMLVGYKSANLCHLAPREYDLYMHMYARSSLRP